MNAISFIKDVNLLLSKYFMRKESLLQNYLKGLLHSNTMQPVISSEPEAKG